MKTGLSRCCVETRKISEKLSELSVPLKETAYLTTYKDGFQWFYNENDVIGRGGKVAGLKLQYIKPYLETIKVLPPHPQKVPLSEFQDKYPIPPDNISKSKVINLKPYYTCKIENFSKDQQPPLKTESEGHLKHLDIYISSSHFGHHPLQQHELKLYESNTSVKKKFHENILPKSFRPVPHSGMESEMKDKYRLPVDEMCTMRFDSNVKMPPVTMPTKAEIMSTPAMYHTEYNHLGTNWPLAAVIG